MYISVYHIEYLRDYFHSLDVLKDMDEKERGKRFEQFIKLVFNFSGYTATTVNKTTYYGEQIDIHAHKENMNVLIEYKWHKKSIGLRHIESFAFRIHKRDPTTIGLFIAMNGISPQAKDFTRYLRDRLLLFITREEILAIISCSLDLEQLINKKIRYLQHGEIYTYGETDERITIDFPPTYPHLNAELTFKNTNLIENIDSRFSVASPISFAKEGFFPIENKKYPVISFYPDNYDSYKNLQQDVGYLASSFNSYYEIFGFTRDLTFGIAQSGVLWSGFGINNFFSNLISQQARYQSKERLHHTETLQIIDFWYDKAILVYGMDSGKVGNSNDFYFKNVNFSLYLINQQEYSDRVKNFSEKCNLIYRETQSKVEIKNFSIDSKRIELIEPTYPDTDINKGKNKKDKDIIGGLAKNPFYIKPENVNPLKDIDPFFEPKKFLQSLPYVYVYSHHTFSEENLKNLFVDNIQFLQFPTPSVFTPILINFVIKW